MTVYQALNRSVEWLNARRSVLILTPYARNIGNCAEDMYYGLLKARRDRKRVMFLLPRPVFWKLRVEVPNPAIVDLISEDCVPNDGTFARLLGWLMTVIFFCLRQLYLRPRACLQYVRRMLKLPPDASRNNVFYVIPSIGRATLWQPDGVRAFSWSIVESLEWPQQHRLAPGLRLRSDDERRAAGAREAMGLPPDGWYVCLHVREGGFHQDWRVGASQSRNCSILRYIDAIRAITAAGGHVVRLGDPTMTPLPAMPGVVDYALGPFKSAFMDLDLVLGCRFYLGVNSGPLDVAWLFSKPVVLTNLSEWTITYPRKSGDLAILRHVFSRSRGRCLGLRELLDESFEAQALWNLGDDYVLIENSAAEIRDLVVEYLEAPAGLTHSDRQREFSSRRRAQIRAWLADPARRFGAHALDDTVERYRIAAHAEHADGALGRKYLEDYWEQDRTVAGDLARRPHVA